MECLNKIVGIVRDCPDCVDGFKDEYKDSLSGLYLEDLKGVDMLRLSSATADVWQLCERSLEVAGQSFLADMTQELYKHIVPARDNFKGIIGKVQFSGLGKAGELRGIKTYSTFRGGKLQVNGIYLMLNTTEAVDLLLYDENKALLQTIPITSEAGKAKYTKIETLTLDINQEYFFVYQSGGRPLMNNFGCCGFVNHYSKDIPKYATKMGWSEWLMAAGVNGADMNSLRQTGNANGLALDVNIYCDGLKILCKDYANDPIGLSIAHAIRYKAGMFLINSMLDSDDVNRYQLLTSETAEAHFEYYNDRYGELVTFIASEMNYFTNDCWKCKDRIIVRGQKL